MQLLMSRVPPHGVMHRSSTLRQRLCLKGCIRVSRVPAEYRGTLLIRNQPPIGPYSRRMPRTLWRP